MVPLENRKNQKLRASAPCALGVGFRGKKSVIKSMGSRGGRRQCARKPLPKTTNRYESVRWDDLWRRLYLHAVKLTRGINTVNDCGVSAEDLVEETLMKFWKFPERLGVAREQAPARVPRRGLGESIHPTHPAREKSG